MDESEIRRRVTNARVARVGTINKDGRVHLVPIVFVLSGEALYSSTDPKPRAQRLANIEVNPFVSVVIDEYDEDWKKVWWVRLRGRGRVLESGDEREHALRLLEQKYPQFDDDTVHGPVMAIDIDRWSGWAYRGE